MRYTSLFVLLLSALLGGLISADAGLEQDQDPNSTNSTDCRMLINADRLGFDFKNVTGTYFTCKFECERTPGCVSWSWSNLQGGMCWLKSRAGRLVSKRGVITTNWVRDEPSPVCNAFTDMEFVGNDLIDVPATKFKNCCDICNETPDCKAYSWSDYLGGTCWLKRSVDRVVRKRGVLSSVTVPLDGPVCAAEFDTNFVGNDLQQTSAADPGACCAACKAHDGCKAYSWTTENGGTCFMKKAKGKAVPATGVISAALAGV